MPVHVAFYVPLTYHEIFGRFFRDPIDIRELEWEYNNYLVQRLFATINLRKQLDIKSVRVDPTEFFEYLASKNLDANKLAENELSSQISLFATTLRPALAPIIEKVQDPPRLPRSDVIYGLMTKYYPLPEIKKSGVPQNSIVGISMVVRSDVDEIIGRYFAWVDGDFPVTRCVKVLEDSCANMPGMQIKFAASAEPLHICACCKLPVAVCRKDTGH